MHNYTPQPGKTERFTDKEAYFDLYFEGLDAVLIKHRMAGGTYAEIASLLSDNPHGITVSAQAVSDMVRRRHQKGGQS